MKKPKIKAEIYRAKYSPQHHMIVINDIRHGPDAAPWDYVTEIFLDIDHLKDAMKEAEAQ